MSARSTFVLAVLAALAISVVPVIAADGQGTPELGSYVTTHRFHSARGASANDMPTVSEIGRARPF